MPRMMEKLNSNLFQVLFSTFARTRKLLILRFQNLLIITQLCLKIDMELYNWPHLPDTHFNSDKLTAKG